MNEVIIEMVAQIVGTFMLMLIGVAGTWLTAKIAKRNELATIAAATEEATAAAQRVVLELQQTVVEGMKAACADGKLSDAEVEQLKGLLIDKALAQLSEPAKKVLAAAGKDVTAIIQSSSASVGILQALSVTGVAGPDKDDRDNEVGTVFVGLSTPEGTTVRQLALGRGRERIRTMAAHYALDMVRRYLTEAGQK